MTNAMTSRTTSTSDIVKKQLTWLTTMFIFLFTASEASGYDETLSFRLTQTGTIEAVVSGVVHGFCDTGRWSEPTSITLTDNNIAIVSYVGELCGLPGPNVPYQVVANLGQLTLPLYGVTWSAGSATLTALLQPSVLALAISVPTMTEIGLILTAALIVMLATKAIRRR